MITELLQGMDDLIEGVTDDMPNTITDWQTQADKHGHPSRIFPSTPKEIKASKKKEYHKKYYKRPEVIKLRKKYQKNYQKTRKDNKQKKFWSDFKNTFNIENLTELLHGMDNLIESKYSLTNYKKSGWKGIMLQHQFDRMIESGYTEEEALSIMHHQEFPRSQGYNKKKKATAAGTSGGAQKGWLTRQHGPDIATRKKHGKYSKWLHDWAKNHAVDLQLDKKFVKQYPEDWIEQSYKQAYRLARKKFY